MEVISFLLILMTILVIFGGVYLVAGYGSGGDPLWFLSGKKIYLIDHWGGYRPTRLNGSFAYIHPDCRIGLVKCNEDGTTSGVSYIKRWEER